MEKDKLVEAGKKAVSHVRAVFGNAGEVLDIAKKKLKGQEKNESEGISECGCHGKGD